MKLTSAALILGTLFVGAAQAGDHGAGPAASSGPGVGSVVTPGSYEVFENPAKDDRGKRVLPGDGGAVTLAGEQLAKTAEALRGFEGASVAGPLIKAPTVLADGTHAVITLNTLTGQLMVTRRGG